jgi:cytochrome c oxidase subunit 5a
MRSQIISTVLRARPSPALLTVIRHVYLEQHRVTNKKHLKSFQRATSTFSERLDLFEVQRGLNNCFSHDLVPSPAVVEAALRAARRVNDYATAVRLLEGIKEKVENKQQYQAYLDELKDVREELGEPCWVVLVVNMLMSLRCGYEGGFVSQLKKAVANFSL